LIETIFLNRENKEKIKEVCRPKYSEDNLADDIKNKVREIILRVKKEGDNALLEFTKKYDGARLNPSEILVGKEEWAKVSQEVRDDLLEVIKEAIKKIKNYHLHQKENSWFTTEEAQAIAALAYGTETIRRVDKIVGPGNIYVTLAKKNVFGEVDIDMLAGPSEILIWADDKANPRYLACDLLSQAEHDVEASAILITTSSLLADKVREEIEHELKNLNRKEIIQESLKKKGKLIVAEDEGIILEFVNGFAPEHLELQIESPWQILGEIKNAGAIFVGAYSPEPLGDYWAGPNHILPTSGGARCFSPLSVKDFTKGSSIIFYDKERLRQASEKIASFARLEGLEAHARSIEIRNLQ